MGYSGLASQKGINFLQKLLERKLSANERLVGAVTLGERLFFTLVSSESVIRSL
jgi:hypothetical protein